MVCPVRKTARATRERAREVPVRMLDTARRQRMRPPDEPVANEEALIVPPWQLVQSVTDREAAPPIVTSTALEQLFSVSDSPVTESTHAPK